MPTADELTEAFLWSEYRVVTKTATVSLHANTYQVDPALVGRKVELVFDPFDLETASRSATATADGASHPAHTSPATRTRKPNPKPPSPTPPKPRTGIDYLA